jgi:hypothetical protein
MQTRELGHTGLRVGELGLGTEHLQRDLANCEAVFELAAASGVSYVDFLFNDPDAELNWWAAVLPPVQRHRERLVLAAHWGWPDYYEATHDAVCFERVLALLGGHAEVGMMTMVDSLFKWETWALAAIEALQAHKAAGRIKAVGLSTHYVATARLAITSGGVDVLMFPINIGLHQRPEELALLAEAAAHGVGVVAMKVYAGGQLLQAKGERPVLTPAQCLAAALDMPISTAAVGVSTPAHLQAALAGYSARAEDKAYEAAVPLLAGGMQGECTYCSHCLPCPVGIDIGPTVHLVDTAQYAPKAELHGDYARLPAPASDCIACGVCEERCPFGVGVIAKMQRACELFEEGS